jgi:hypothetical protein
LGAGRRVTILGVGGDTVETAMGRLCQSGAFPAARVYVVCLGTNNLAGAPQDVTVDRLRYLVDFVRARQSKAHIVVLSLFWRGDLDFGAVQAFNAKILAMAKAGDRRTHYADWPATLVNRADFAPTDLVHPLEGGWAKVLNKLVPFLKLLLSKP